MSSIDELRALAARLMNNPDGVTNQDVEAYRRLYLQTPGARQSGVMDPGALRAVMERSNRNIKRQWRQENVYNRPTPDELLANPEQYGITPEEAQIADPLRRGNPTPEERARYSDSLARLNDPSWGWPQGSTPPSTPGGPGTPPPSYPDPTQPPPAPPPGSGQPRLPTPPVGGNPGYPGRPDPNLPPPATPPGGGLGGGLPGPGTGPDRGGLQQPLAAFGFVRGPAGEVLPLMLEQGGNPFQTPQPGGGIPLGGYTDPVQLGRMLYNPNIQGYQWFQPPPPPAPPPGGGGGGPPPGGGTNPGAPPPGGGGGPPPGGGGGGPPPGGGGVEPGYPQIPKAGSWQGVPLNAIGGLLGGPKGGEYATLPVMPTWSLI